MTIEIAIVIMSKTATVEIAIMIMAKATTIKISIKITSEASPFEATTIEPASVKAGEPGAGSDKTTANEIVGAIVAIGRAIIRVIPVVTVGTNGRRAYVDWANTELN
jgi:hypothetical protein